MRTLNIYSNKILQNATLMYRFGERYLVYNVNVCILQLIFNRIYWISKGYVQLIKGQTYESRRKVTQDFNCGR